MLQAGTRLNDTYTLLEQIGSGGGGIVYKAYHEHLRTYVVVKQMKAKARGVLDARGEADVLKNIKHTRLPRVYDFLDINGEIFTVMDFVPGESLDKVLLREGRFGQKEVFHWTLHLAEVLSYLHSRTPSVIHSDIKPANVMLLPNRDICLIDFNVSLAFDRGLRMSTGVSRGYSPPEQYHDFASYCKCKHMQQGNPYNAPTMTMKEIALMWDETQTMNPAAAKTESLVSEMLGRGVDERSDIYSLGATVYHLLTGRKPEASFEAIIPIHELMPELSEGFAVIIEKMMALSPEERYQNGTELLYALEHVYELDSEYRAFCRGRSRRKLLIAGMLAAGIAAGVGGFLMMQKENRTAYNRGVEEANVLIESGDYDEAEELLKAVQQRLPADIHSYKAELLRLFAMGEYAQAVDYGKDMINNPVYITDGEEAQTSYADLFYILGNAYFEQDDYGNAGQCFERAIENNSKNSLYFRDEAIVQAKTGNFEEAEKTLETAVELGLGEDSIYMAQGEIVFSKGEYEAAVQYLKKAMLAAETKELRRRSVILCAQAYKSIGNTWLDEEIALLEESENTFSAQISMHLTEMLADAYARKAEADISRREEYYEKALTRFQSLYENGYSTEQMMENIAILYEQTEQTEKAQAMLLEMAEKYPEDYVPYMRLAFLEADIQQKKENSDRDYAQMKMYYEQAAALYGAESSNGDTEMQMLENMMLDLEKGGWF